MRKAQADVLLVEQGQFPDRAQAQTAILAGLVRVGPDHVVRAGGERWPADTVFAVAEPPKYVSRAAAKLLPALGKHLPDLTGLTAMDVGASTGGFTDLMLQRGAKRVYAVDVGKGLLAWRLRQNSRVVCLEQVNARYLTAELAPEPIDVLTVDLSFISVRQVLPAVDPLLAAGAWAFILIKPQFEAERGDVGKGGVVRSAEVRQRVVAEIGVFCEANLGWHCADVLPSPVKGAKGNQEYVGVYRRGRGAAVT